MCEETAVGNARSGVLRVALQEIYVLLANHANLSRMRSANIAFGFIFLDSVEVVLNQSDLGYCGVVSLNDLGKFLFGISCNKTKTYDAKRNDKKKTGHRRMIARGMRLVIFCCAN